MQSALSRRWIQSQRATAHLESKGYWWKSVEPTGLLARPTQREGLRQQPACDALDWWCVHTPVGNGGAGQEGVARSVVCEQRALLSCLAQGILCDCAPGAGAGGYTASKCAQDSAGAARVRGIRARGGGANDSSLSRKKADIGSQPHFPRSWWPCSGTPAEEGAEGAETAPLAAWRRRRQGALRVRPRASELYARVLTCFSHHALAS